MKKAFSAFENMDYADTEEMHKLVKLVCKELKVHTEIEERIEESEMFPKARCARLHRRALGGDAHAVNGLNEASPLADYGRAGVIPKRINVLRASSGR